MFDNFTLTLENSRRLKNYRKNKNYNNKLLKVENIALSTYNITVDIFYKRTIPLNLFEKYSLRLIEEAEKINDDMNIDKISQILFLDGKIIKQNLNNLQEIGMVDGVDSDIITINRDKNAEYLQFECKFKTEEIRKNFDITESEKNDLESFIQNWFERDKENNDKKFSDYRVISESESLKNIILLIFENKEFRLLGKQGINHESDLKFFYGKEIEGYFSNLGKHKKNVYCHKDEFLPESLLSGQKNKKVFLSFDMIEFERYESLFKSLESNKEC